MAALGLWQRRLPRYVVVGLLAYLLEAACLLVLGRQPGFSPTAAVAVSFWVGLITSFWLQKRLTYLNHDLSAKSLGRQGLAYGLLVIWNYGFSLLLVRWLGGRFGALPVRTAAIAIITSWNFLLYGYVFKSRVVPLE